MSRSELFPLAFCLLILGMFCLIILALQNQVIELQRNSEYQHRQSVYNTLTDLVECKGATDSATIIAQAEMKKVLNDRGEGNTFSCQ